MEDGPLLSTNIKRPLSGRSLRYVTQFSNFGTPNNLWTKRAFPLKFGTDVEDGPSLRTDYKTTPKWAWPGSSDLISKFCDTLNNFWTNWAICFKFGTEMDDGPSCVDSIKRSTLKWTLPGSYDPISKFWDPPGGLKESECGLEEW